MKVIYRKRFIKDMKALQGSPVYETIHDLVFARIPSLNDLAELDGVVKLKGSTNAYRVRVGDYRIGFFWDGEVLKFARVLHRREIYRKFP